MGSGSDCSREAGKVHSYRAEGVIPLPPACNSAALAATKAMTDANLMAVLALRNSS
jgi:hypothetical protein